MANRKKELPEGISNFVVTFPLKTELYQEHILDNYLSMITDYYNSILCRLNKLFYVYESNKEFRSLPVEERRNWIDKHVRLVNDYSFNEYGINKYISKIFYSNEKNHSKKLNSAITEDIAKRLSSAFEKKINAYCSKSTKKIPSIHYSDGIKSFSSRIINNTHFIGMKFEYDKDNDKHYIIFNTLNVSGKNAKKKGNKNKKKNNLKIEFIVNKNSEYEIYAFNPENKMKVVRIKKEIIRGKTRYFLQITFEGKCFSKYRKLGSGRIACDAGPSKMAIVTDTKCAKIDLWDGDAKIAHKIKNLQRKMDRSRRANNPDNYNEDGTFKVQYYIDKKGNKRKKKKYDWVKSNNYKKLQKEYRELNRKNSAKRKIYYYQIANEWCKYGDTTITEDDEFPLLAKRGKRGLNKNGKEKSRKRFGRVVGSCAPGLFRLILEHRIKSLGGNNIRVSRYAACTQYDFTNQTFTPHDYRKERVIKTSDGILHDRDMIAAFNIQHYIGPVIDKKSKAKQKRIKKNSNYFDNDKMRLEYDSFVNKSQYVLTA